MCVLAENIIMSTSYNSCDLCKDADHVLTIYRLRIGAPDEIINFLKKGGCIVEIYGSWNNWSEGTKLLLVHNNGFETFAHVDITVYCKRDYEYKWKVNGKWIIDTSKARVNIGKWNENNFISHTKVKQSREIIVLKKY